MGEIAGPRPGEGQMDAVVAEVVKAANEACEQLSPEEVEKRAVAAFKKKYPGSPLSQDQRFKMAGAALKKYENITAANQQPSAACLFGASPLTSPAATPKLTEAQIDNRLAEIGKQLVEIDKEIKTVERQLKSDPMKTLRQDPRLPKLFVLLTKWTRLANERTALTSLKIGLIQQKIESERVELSGQLSKQLGIVQPAFGEAATSLGRAEDWGK